MKKLVLSLVLVAGLAFAANAQQGGGRMAQATPEEKVKQLDEKVKLSAEQKTKATVVYTEAAEAQKKMREEMQAGGDRQAMMEHMQKMNEDTDKKLNAVLVAGLTFVANAQQGGGRMGQASPTEKVKQLDDKVKLSDEQKTKATVVYSETADSQKKMREEMQAGGDRQGMMEKMQKMNADTDKKLNEMLTADQQKAYKTWQDEVKAAREKMMRERQGGGE